MQSSVSATARDYYGFSSAMSYSRLILSACSKDQLPLGMLTPLPPRHLATLTIQHHQDSVYTLLPFFDETSLYYSVDAVYKAQTNPHAVVTDHDHWNVRMVLAISNALLSAQRGDQNYMEAVGHVSAALMHAEQVLRPGTIANVQALLFLTIYAMCDPHHFDSWGLIGAASRAMVDIGLHHDPPRGLVTKAKLNLRRRVYYCVYMLDRSTSIVQTRAFSFSDDSASVSSPFKSSSDPTKSSDSHRWLKGSDHVRDLLRLRQIQSTCYSQLFQSGREPWSDPYPRLWSIYHDLANWFKTLSRNTAQHIRTYFELELLYSYVYFLSPSPRVPATSPYVQNLVFEHCISYATLLNQAINDPKHVVPITFYDAMRAYMTGRQFLDVLSTDADRLLTGDRPDAPISAGSREPPQAPTLPLAPTDVHANIVRAISCIKQLTDALGMFGTRWGYMSWRDSFEKVAEPALTMLNQRLWETRDPSPASSTTSRRQQQPQWYHGPQPDSMPALRTMDSQGSYQSQASSTYDARAEQQQSNMAAAAVSASAYGHQDALMHQMMPSLQQTQSYSSQTEDVDYQRSGQVMYDRPGQQFTSWQGLGQPVAVDQYGRRIPSPRSGADGNGTVPPS